MSFYEEFIRYNPIQVREMILSSGENDVLNALHKKGRRDLRDLTALLSPAASRLLPELWEKSRELTRKRFGKTMQMYIPLYLSNECQNICTYCGFSLDNKIKRLTLNPEQVLKEVEEIKKHGFEHVLLVTGEAWKSVGMPYFTKMLELLNPHFSYISMEVQPLDQEDYMILIEKGLKAVLVYQETYHEEIYKEYHPKGRKANFRYRLETPDRLGKSRIQKIGIGSLLGLADWRVDSFFTGLHLSYLEKKYWQTKYSISFPRLRPAEGVHIPDQHVSDRDLIQLICAFRIFNEDVELSLSTRESEFMRENLIDSAITSMSAGSRTNPGGYTEGAESLEQFEISDERSPEDMAKLILAKGFEPVWKDWEPAYWGA